MTLVSPPSLTALQENVVPAVSAVSVLVSHPFGFEDDRLGIRDGPAGRDVGHVPAVRPEHPDGHRGVTTGGVGSPGTSGALTAPGVRSRAVRARSTSAGRWRISRASRTRRRCCSRSEVHQRPPDESGPDVPAIDAWTQPVAAPPVNPRPPYLKAWIGVGQALSTLPVANELDVVVAGSLDGAPPEPRWSGEPLAGRWVEERTGSPGYDSPICSRCSPRRRRPLRR